MLLRKSGRGLLLDRPLLPQNDALCLQQAPNRCQDSLCDGNEPTYGLSIEGYPVSFFSSTLTAPYDLKILKGSLGEIIYLPKEDVSNISFRPRSSVKFSTMLP